MIVAGVLPNQSIPLGDRNWSLGVCCGGCVGQSKRCDHPTRCIDSTIVRGDVQAAGAKGKGLKKRCLVVRKELHQ